MSEVLEKSLPYIRIVGVSKAYPSHHVQALHAITFTLPKGSTTALMGPSGCGKSTLLNLLGGLDSPDGGEIWIGEQSIHNQTSSALANFRKTQIGVVFQQFNVLDALTVAQNVALPLALQGLDSNAAKLKVTAILDAVGLDNRENFYPSQLSGGQLQRVAVARALIHHPSVVLADEPTGNLDSATGSQILTLLTDLCRTHGTTLIMATHSEAAAEQLDYRLTLCDGQLVSISQRSLAFNKAVI